MSLKNVCVLVHYRTKLGVQIKVVIIIIIIIIIKIIINTIINTITFIIMRLYLGRFMDTDLAVISIFRSYDFNISASWNS